MTAGLVEAVNQFSYTSQEVHKLDVWESFTAAKKALKKEFKLIDTSEYRKDSFFSALDILGGEKTAKKVAEWLKKNSSSFSVDSTKEMIFSDSFMQAALTLEDTTAVIKKQFSYQEFSAAKQELKNIAKQHDTKALVEELKGTKFDPIVDVNGIIKKIEYWQRKFATK